MTSSLARSAEAADEVAARLRTASPVEVFGPIATRRPPSGPGTWTLVARAADRALLKRFQLFGPPGIVFFDAQGREIKGLRVIGYQNAERFSKTLSLATSP